MTTPTTPIRVLIADDQKVVRDGLAMLLGLLDGIEVVGTAVDGADAIRQAQTADPDIVLMDLNMPTVDGVEATRRLTGRPLAPAGRRRPADRRHSRRQPQQERWPG